MAKSDSAAMRLALKKPDFKLLITSSDTYREALQHAVFYTHSVVESKKLKKAALAMALDYFPDMDHEVLGKLTDSRYDSVGKYCFILQSGGQLVEDDIKSIENVLNGFITAYNTKSELEPQVDEEEESEEDKAKKPSIQDYMLDKALSVCESIDVMLDQYCSDPGKFKFNIEPKSLFMSNQLKAGHYIHIIKIYEPLIAELKEAIEGKDPDLKEAYGFMTKTQLKKYVQFLETIISDATFLKTANISNKKPRKKRPIDKAKICSKMKYLLTDTDTGINSVNPVHIFGAKAVWLYNTRTRKIAFYEQHDESGLTVSGTSIKGFSEKSVERTVRASAKLDLVKFAEANKSTQKRMYKKLTSMETKPRGRTNEHVLILSVDK